MIPALLLIFFAIAYRIATGLFAQPDTAWLSYFTPMAALALCSVVYLPRALKFTLPLLALLVSDVILNIHYSASIFDPLILVRYCALALVGCFGLLLQNRASLKTMLPASIGASIIFYLLTNFFSWLSDPGYAKNFAGLIQAMTVGLPGYAPTWMFFRNSLLSDLFFTAAFVLCLSAKPNPARPTAPLPRAA